MVGQFSGSLQLELYNIADAPMYMFQPSNYVRLINSVTTILISCLNSLPHYMIVQSVVYVLYNLYKSVILTQTTLWSYGHHQAIKPSDRLSTDIAGSF